MQNRSLLFASMLLLGLGTPASAIVDWNRHSVQEGRSLNTPTLAQMDPRLAEADRLDQQVIQLYQQGRYEEGIAVARQVMEIRESILGDHPDTATILLGLGLG